MLGSAMQGISGFWISGVWRVETWRVEVGVFEICGRFSGTSGFMNRQSGLFWCGNFRFPELLREEFGLLGLRFGPEGSLLFMLVLGNAAS